MKLVWIIEDGEKCGPYRADDEYLEGHREDVEDPKPEHYFNVVDMELESDNYHGMIGFPAKVFEAVSPFLSPGSELKAAEAICEIGWMK